jgi:cytosine/adenosine deaminase-related metal-dependent hydrolase
MLLQRVSHGADAMSAREALEIATRGGAEVLGRPECGMLAPGKRADIAIWNVGGLEAAGSWDPVAALILCGPHRARDVIVDGKPVVRDFNLITAQAGEIVSRANAAARKLAI